MPSAERELPHQAQLNKPREQRAEPEEVVGQLPASSPLNKWLCIFKTCECWIHLPEKCHKELDKVHNTVVLGEGDLWNKQKRMWDYQKQGKKTQNNMKTGGNRCMVRKSVFVFKPNQMILLFTLPVGVRSTAANSRLRHQCKSTSSADDRTVLSQWQALVKNDLKLIGCFFSNSFVSCSKNTNTKCNDKCCIQ